METTSIQELFILEVPQNEVSLFKQIVQKMGWGLHSESTMTAYEQSLDDLRNGRVNHYNSSEDFFAKMGI